MSWKIYEAKGYDSNGHYTAAVKQVITEFREWLEEEGDGIADIKRHVITVLPIKKHFGSAHAVLTVVYRPKE